MIASARSKDLLRQRYVVTERSDTFSKVHDRNFINFSNNDYLNLSTNKLIKKAFQEGIERYGVGSGSSALLCGYFKPHHELEEKFANFLRRDKALLFNSGYVANLAVLTTFANRHKTIISDKYCHASLLDGIQLSKAKHKRYLHNDLQHLQEIAAQNLRNIVVTESVFSMEGAITPLPEIAKLSKMYKQSLIVDDAHGLGVLGARGAGICEFFNLQQQDVQLVVSPLGKAFGGMGAIVSGDANFIEEILQTSKTYRYTTALPPAIPYAMLAALDIVENETWRRDKLRKNILFFLKNAAARNINLLSTDITPIKSILIGDNLRALQLKDQLIEKGILVSCIRPPTVPVNSARLRISLSAAHTEDQIVRLLDGLV